MRTEEIRGKRAFGIFIDGYELKFVEVAAVRGGIALKNFRTEHLVRKLDEVSVQEPAMSLAGGEGIDFSSPAPLQTESAQGQESNASALANLLAGEKGYVLAHAIAEPGIYYHVLDSDFGLKGEKLRRRVMEELEGIRTATLAPDAVGYLPLEEGGILCAVREDGVGFLRLLDLVRPMMKRVRLKISVYEPSDIALVNLVRLNYAFHAEETTVIAYIGSETSRLVFLKGEHLWHIAPMISEGADSPSILNTVYSRILLEQDNLAVPKLTRILLAGEAVKLNAQEFFLRQFREVEIEYLVPKKLDLSQFTLDIHPQLSEYAVPIASAIRALEPKEKRFYALDLLPASVREGQKSFKIGWHGCLLLGLIFLVTLLLTLQVASKRRDIRQGESALAAKKVQLLETIRIQNQIDSLNALRTKYQTAQALYDSLTPGADRWSKAISHLTRGVEDVNALWLTDLHSTQPQGMVVNGFSIYRSRVPRISNLFEGATLKQVIVQKIRDKLVYKYEIDVEKLQDR